MVLTKKVLNKTINNIIQYNIQKNKGLLNLKSLNFLHICITIPFS